MLFNEVTLVYSENRTTAIHIFHSQSAELLIVKAGDTYIE